MSRGSTGERAAAVLLALSLAALAVLVVVQRFPMADLLVYRAEGEAVVEGSDLYGFTVTRWELPATYPPFAALLFVPTVWLSPAVAKAAFLAGNAALLGLLVHLSLRTAGVRGGAPVVRGGAEGPAGPGTPGGADDPAQPGTPGGKDVSPHSAGDRPRGSVSPLFRPVRLARGARLLRGVRLFRGFQGVRGWSRPATVLAVTALALWLEPVFQTLVFGQINLLLVCLVLWDLDRPEGARAKGLAIGVASGIKLTPAVFAVHLLLTGRIRAGLTAIAGFAGTVAAGALVLPSASWEFFTRRVFETARVGKAWIVDNQSLQGAVARVAHTAEPGLLWILPAAAVAAAGLMLARRLHVRHGQPAWAVLVTAGTALLVSPISWSHHWVWCVPLLVLLAAERARAGAGQGLVLAVVAVFSARTLWLVPKHGADDLRLEWWMQPFGSPYALLTLGLLTAAAVRYHRGAWAVRRPFRALPEKA